MNLKCLFNAVLKFIPMLSPYHWVPVAVAVADAVPVPVAEDVEVPVLVGEPVEVLVLLPLDVPVPVELVVPVAVDVLVALAVAEADPVFVPDVVIEADEVLVDVLVAEDVPVDVGVDELVPVDVGEAVPVDVAVELLVVVAVDEDVLVDELDATETPTCPPRTCQRYVEAVSETEISDSMSPASANVADVSRAAFQPAAAVTAMSPPPSVSIRRTKRMPGFVGGAKMRVSPDAPDVISQI